MFPKSLKYFLTGIVFSGLSFANAQTLKTSIIANNGWANNSVNTVIFRKNSLVTLKNNQYAAFYDSAAHVVLAQRTTGTDNWKVVKTDYQGDATDAHKSISIMVDGGGYLHIVWGQHNNKLNYARSVSPGSLALTTKLAMIGKKEDKVSYPEFYKLQGGNLLFFYRDGMSGNGSLIINHYDYKTRQWTRLQDNLIDGEGQRSAYWQIATDIRGAVHLSWVWRETPDVATNHDMAYACSKDGGKTWQKSTGEKYVLPITAANAEYAVKIPQNSDLINQTSMFADAMGYPYIATYYKDSTQTAPQYHIVYFNGKKWAVSSMNFNTIAFSLKGGGTKSIPLSRPQVVAWNNGKKMASALVFRDEAFGNKIMAAVSADIKKGNWQVKTLFDQSVGSWEPTFDTELWKNKGILNLFVERVTQVDGEGNSKTAPQRVEVLQWDPKINK